MKNVTIILTAVTVMVWAVAPAGATPSSPYTLADTTLASEVDPAGGATVDIDSSGGTKTYSGAAAGTFMTKANFNALSGMYVVDFNDAVDTGNPAKEMWTGGSQGSGASTGLVKIEATYSGTKRVDFSNVDTGTDDFSSDGYNYGGYTSGGRTATSGSNAYDTMGLLDGACPDGYTRDGTDGVLLHMDITMVGAPGEYVKSVAFCLICKDNETHQDVEATFTMDDGSWATVNVGNLGKNQANKDVMFAYQAADGRSIASFKIKHDGTYENGHSALDDLGFQVVPEPATMVLLGIGGIGILIRRKRR